MRSCREFTELSENLVRGETPVLLTGCTSVQKAQLVYAAGQSYPLRLLIAEDELKAKQLYEDYREFDSDTVYYPDKDLIFFENSGHNPMSDEPGAFKAALREKAAKVMEKDLARI